jgi:hypothetical protein
MNRLTRPIVAHTLSGAALSPCAEAGGTGDLSGAGSEGPTGANGTPPPEAPVDLLVVPSLDSPSEVSVVGLRRSLRGLVLSLSPVAQYLTDLSDFETERLRRQRPTPIELCHWLDALQRAVDEISSQATLAHHVCDVLWEHASLEAARRREAELEIARGGG